MKILYLDCTNGVSGDMVLTALSELGDCGAEVAAKMESEDFSHSHSHHSHHSHNDADHGHNHNYAGSGCVNDHDHDHAHGHIHTHGRSYSKVKELIENSSFSPFAKSTALKIYSHIAKAEASVHGAPLDTVHFHEVGRDEAIKNALGIGMALEAIAPDRVSVSTIYDGKGTITCSHGEIPVPVPAVMALREQCSYSFETADVNTEMVTPSGLAAVMGIGAQPGELTGTIIKQTEAFGKRATGRGGLKAYVTEVDR